MLSGRETSLLLSHMLTHEKGLIGQATPTRMCSIQILSAANSQCSEYSDIPLGISVQTGAWPVVEKAVDVSEEEGGSEKSEHVFSPQGKGLGGARQCVGC